MRRGAPSCRGVCGRSSTSSPRARLDDPACVEDRDAIGNRRHDPEVVGDQDDRQVVLAAQAVEEPQDPGLDGDIEGRRRLVGDQQLGPAGEGDRDRDPLPHPARELVGIGTQGRLAVGDAHLLEQLERALVGGVTVDAEVALHMLGELAADVSIGCSEVSGSWKTIAMSRPEISRSWVRESPRRSLPSKLARPSRAAPSGRSPSRASIEIVLPLPLSPAIPNTSPRSTW